MVQTMNLLSMKPSPPDSVTICTLILAHDPVWKQSACVSELLIIHIKNNVIYCWWPLVHTQVGSSLLLKWNRYCVSFPRPFITTWRVGVTCSFIFNLLFSTHVWMYACVSTYACITYVLCRYVYGCIYLCVYMYVCAIVCTCVWMCSIHSFFSRILN